MHLIVNSGFIFDIFKLALYIAIGYLAFSFYARRARTPWLLTLATQRMAVLTLLTLLVVGVKVFEDVIGKESSLVDLAILWFIRQTLPPSLLGFFSAVTWTGAAVFLVPATVAMCGLLFVRRHHREAVLLAVTMAAGWALTYAVKSMVGRARPELWSTTWYWGSSFPSGHTLSTAAFATALTLIASRIRPQSRLVALPLAVLWVSLMGLSRLVLGVHWPTDVLAAICLGVFIALAVSILLDLYQYSKNSV